MMLHRKRQLIRAGVATLMLAAITCTALPLSQADGVADEADLQFQLGAAAYAKANFDNALEHFLASNRLVPNRNVMFNIARAFEQVGRFADAYRYYVDAGRDGSEGKLGSDVAAALARIAPKVVVIQLDTIPAGATVYVNRKNLGSIGTTPSQLGVPAGQYSIIAELPGYEPYQSPMIDGKIGGTHKLQVTLKAILGKVAITGSTGTEARFDDDRGAAACQVPCTKELQPGEHTVFFRKPGFTAPMQRFTVAEKQTVTLTVETVPQAGSLLISAEENNALIEIDGKPAGFTPTVVTGVAVGKRHLRISLPGFAPVERDVEIVANQQLDVRNVAMQPERSVAAASREAENIDDAPASVTIISRRELEAFAYPTVLEALRGVRGFATGYDSIYGNVGVRGLGQANDYNNRLLLLSDGAVLNDAFLYQAFIHYDGRVDLGDIDRIEVVRGPASVLYGNGAVSGVINMVMRDKNAPAGVTAEVSSYDNQTARVRVQGLVRSGKTGAWASIAAAGSQGRTANLDFATEPGMPVTANPITTFDKFTAATTSGKVWFNKLSLQWVGTLRHLFVPTGNGASFNDPTSVADDGRGMVELKYQTALSKTADATLRAVYNYTYFNLDFGASNTSIIRSDFRRRETYRGHGVGSEARVAWRVAPTFKLTASGEITAALKQNMRGSEDSTLRGVFDTTLRVNAPSQLFAGSLLGDWKPNATLRINGGVRADYTNLLGNRDAPAGQNGKDAFLAFSPRVAVIVKPNPTNIIKLIAGRAFRAPSTYEFFYDDGGLSQISPAAANTTLRPEQIYSGEIEFTHRFDRVWSVLGAAHGLLAQGIIETTQEPSNPDVFFYRNSLVNQLAIGGDIEVRRELRAGITASAHYGYLYGRYQSSPNPDDPLLPQSLQLPNAPAHFAGAKIIFPVSSSINGALRASLEDRRRVDPTVEVQSNRAVIADAVISGNLSRFGAHYALGAYNIFNVRYAVPALPFASNLMPQNGRSLIFSIGLTR